MCIYVPERLAASPGVVVSLHGASGNSQQQYLSTPYASLAEIYGFIAIYPESPQGAWDATSSKSLLHDGGGASQSIANMVRYALTTYKADQSKVFVSGVSSGGSMAVSYFSPSRSFYNSMDSVSKEDEMIYMLCRIQWQAPTRTFSKEL